MLGDEVMVDGDSKYATLLGHVSYDFKAVESTGETCTLRNIDLSVNRLIIIDNNRCYISSQTTSTQY
jgi:hypothetical protein